MGPAASRDDVIVSMTKTITLISFDNERFEVPEPAASLSPVIRNAIDNNDGSAAAAAADGGIQLSNSNIPGKVLAKVLEYCNKHAAGSKTSSGEATTNSNEELRSFDKKFMEVDQFTLYELLVGAYYLEVQGLLDLVCQEVCDRLEDKTREENRKEFRIKDDYFPNPPDEDDDDEEEEQWIFV